MKKEITVLTIILSLATGLCAQTVVGGAPSGPPVVSGGVNNHGPVIVVPGNGPVLPNTSNGNLAGQGPNNRLVVPGNGFVASGLSNRFVIPGGGLVVSNSNNRFITTGNNFVTAEPANDIVAPPNRFIVPTNQFESATNVVVAPTSGN